MTRYVYDAKQGKVVPKHERTDRPVHQIISDWKPYRSPLGDGKVIDGRAAAREHHKVNNTRVLEPGETRQAMKIRDQNMAEMRQGFDPSEYRRGDAVGEFTVRTERR